LPDDLYKNLQGLKLTFLNRHQLNQYAKMVVSNSTGLVDFAVRQGKFLGKSFEGIQIAEVQLEMNFNGAAK